MKLPVRIFILAGLVGSACVASDLLAASWDRGMRRPRSAIPEGPEKPRPARKEAESQPRVIDGVPVQSIEGTMYVPPKPAKLEPPVYPYDMLKERVSGEASISCMVDTVGRVVQVRVLNATRPEFAEALTAAIEATQFAYATREGSPITSVLGFRFKFEPRGEADPYREDLDLLERSVRRPHSLGHPQRLDKPLRVKKQPAPAFPMRMLKTGTRGTALIEFLLDEYGEARLPRVKSASDPTFGYAAVHAVSQWRFEPPTVDGQPAVVRVSVPFVFSVE